MSVIIRSGALRAGLRSIAFGALAAPAILAQAQPDSAQRRDTTRLSTVTVIGSRGDIAETRERLFHVPGSVAMISPSELRSSRQTNLHEALKFTPGVVVQPRFGAADETQISVRGSGLRNNFHARGINLLVNGMPYRNADGFTDFESLEMLTTEAIEVHKGANALRYGGSTLGGAINLHTQTGYTAPPLSAYLQSGAHGFGKGQLAAGGERAGFDWYASAAHTQLEGFRDWSAQRRDRVNLHAGKLLGRATDVRGFYFFADVLEELPGSLTRAEFESDAGMANAANAANRWGRDYTLHHAGVQLRAQLTPTQRLEVSPYVQYREIDHPIFQVINQRSHDWGAEVRYESAMLLFGRENSLVVGFQPAYLTMRNKQFENVQGEHGPLTRDERDYATTLALYAEHAVQVSERLRLVAGFRTDRSTRRVDDDFLSNGDQTDRRTYDAFTPRVGFTMHATPTVQLFANASRTVEPPLLLELSSFGNPGGFVDLKSQKAWQYELGVRSHKPHGINWELSLFDVELRDELLNQNVQPFPGAPFTVPTYRNVPATRHLGAEAGVSGFRSVRLFRDGGERAGIRAAYTFHRFTFLKDAQFAGNELPGAPRHLVSAEARYSHPRGFSLAPSLEWNAARYFVNSENTVTNDPWVSVGARADLMLPRLGTTLFLHAQNLTDERYSASVQVDNAAGRFFEPADPRSLYLGFRWTR